MRGRPRLGHVQLRVSDLSRARMFYERLLGWPVREGGPGIAFLGPGPDHHQLALLDVREGAPFAADTGGLSHVAFEVESRDALVEIYRRLSRRGVSVSCFDLGVSWSLYL